MMNSLAEFWESYLTDVVTVEIPEEAREVLRETFYAGAKAASMMCKGRDRKHALARVQKLLEELKEYQDGLFKSMPNATERTQ